MRRRMHACIAGASSGSLCSAGSEGNFANQQRRVFTAAAAAAARPTTWRCWACPRQARDMAREIRIARRAASRQHGRACSRRSPARGVPCLAGCRWRCPPAPVFYLRVISNQSVKSQNRADGWLPRPLVQSSGDQLASAHPGGEGAAPPKAAAAHKSAAVSAAIMADSFQPAKRASLCSAAVVKSFCDEACGSNGRARCGRLDLTEL